MTPLSRLFTLAALSLAVLPATVLAQSSTVYVHDPNVLPASAMAGGPATGCAAGSCCDAACGPSCGGCCGLQWPCGCLLADLGEPCKLWQPCCEDSPWSAGGWIAGGGAFPPVVIAAVASSQAARGSTRNPAATSCGSTSLSPVSTAAAAASERVARKRTIKASMVG